MKVVFALVVISCFALRLPAQSKDTLTVEEEYTKPWRYGISTAMFGIHIMPLSFVGRHPRLRLGAQVRTDRFDYVLDLEYGNRWLRDIPSKYDPLPYVFLGMRPEIRYSLQSGPWGDFARYIGIEFPVTWFKKGLRDNGYDTDTLHYQFDSATAKRFRFGFLVKYGTSVDLGDRGYLDYYIGMGWARRHVEYTDVVNLQADSAITREWGISNHLTPGYKNVLDLALGVRIGYFIVE